MEFQCLTPIKYTSFVGKRSMTSFTFLLMGVDPHEKSHIEAGSFFRKLSSLPLRAND